MSLYWTKTRIIRAIQLWYEENGYPPVWRDWAKRKGLAADYPVSTTVRQTFGSWNAAIKEAGLMPQPDTHTSPRASKLTAADRRQLRIQALHRALKKEEA